jgi:hypothetical protein
VKAAIKRFEDQQDMETRRVVAALYPVVLPHCFS